MPGCVMRYCKNTSKNVCKSSGITFHRFLRADHIKREEWIKIVQNNRSEYTWLPSEHSCICSAHFKTDDFHTTKTGRRFLKKSAIPYNPLEHNSEDRPASPTSLDDVEISDTESILDTPKEIQLKKDLRQSLEAKKKVTTKIKKLQRQNRKLREEIKTLIDIVKHLKQIPK